MIKSSVLLTHRRPFATAVNALDRTIALPFREFRGLPPNHLRIRTGVGNRILFNQPLFLEGGSRGVTNLLGAGLLALDGRMVDVGSGCGRLAHALRLAGFRGKYTGIDADREMVEWCRAHFAAETFEFHHACSRTTPAGTSWSRSGCSKPKGAST